MPSHLQSAFLSLVLAASLPAYGLAQEAGNNAYDQSVFVMGGPFANGYFPDTFLFWSDHYESNAFLGVGYQRFFYDYNSFSLGVEAGAGVRFGTPVSLELWAGGVGRLTTFEIGNLNITPALTAGFSVVTDTVGVETERTNVAGEQANLLFYLGPELAVSLDDHPQWEAFARIQHRSGGFGTIAHIDGSNAATLGIRYKF